MFLSCFSIPCTTIFCPLFSRNAIILRGARRSIIFLGSTVIIDTFPCSRSPKWQRTWWAYNKTFARRQCTRRGKQRTQTNLLFCLLLRFWMNSFVLYYCHIQSFGLVHYCSDRDGIKGIVTCRVSFEIVCYVIVVCVWQYSKLSINHDVTIVIITSHSRIQIYDYFLFWYFVDNSFQFILFYRFT